MNSRLLEIKTNVLLAVFITALVLANVLGSKVTTIFGVVTSVGIFAYPITFLITDAVEEVRGKRVTKVFVYAGFVALILSIVLVWIGIKMPPASFYTNNEAYNSVFSNSIRIIIASITAFLISQTHDIWAFNFWKQKTHGKYLWLRNNLSTIASQLIDTAIFTTIAFYQVAPGFTAVRVVQMIIPYWILKVGFALLDTPFVYVLVKWLKSE
ncbi:queuosine precursor transporter [Candidatus Woesearchaeota archaeon]|nr:queuosine precursor transporter [Candidatus Woesearchaeota archaeon]